MREGSGSVSLTKLDPDAQKHMDPRNPDRDQQQCINAKQQTVTCDTAACVRSSASLALGAEAPSSAAAVVASAASAVLVASAAAVASAAVASSWLREFWMDMRVSRRFSASFLAFCIFLMARRAASRSWMITFKPKENIEKIEQEGKTKKNAALL